MIIGCGLIVGLKSTKVPVGFPISPMPASAWGCMCKILWVVGNMFVCGFCTSRIHHIDVRIDIWYVLFFLWYVEDSVGDCQTPLHRHSSCDM